MRAMRTILLTALLAAACGSPQQAVRIQTPEEALSADAASLARDAGVSQAEAERRLRAQAVLGDHLARLREAHRARVAGIYYQSAPDFRVVVRLKGDAPVAANALNESPVAGVPIEFRTGAAHSLDELLALQEAHRAEIAAMMLYFIEGDTKPAAFGSIMRSMWWAIVTLTTVGYGDVYPETALGRVAAGIVALAGIGIVAMPTGILASAFAEEFRERHEAQQARERDAGETADKGTGE
jgi:hypothetical protein